MNPSFYGEVILSSIVLFFLSGKDGWVGALLPRPLGVFKNRGFSLCKSFLFFLKILTESHARKQNKIALLVTNNERRNFPLVKCFLSKNLHDPG
jgi:hypothetical protein